MDVLFNPGIYKITCSTLKNNKVYIGQSNNLLVRLGRHAEKLQVSRINGPKKNLICMEKKILFLLWLEVRRTLPARNFINRVFEDNTNNNLLNNWIFFILATN